ncbi:MAG: hypothetical protein CMJ34_06745 [Phycisphaerae bacterium]|nr:hypothetical protein [Phycisphaerae bacterium]
MLHLTRCTWHGAVVQMPIQSPYKLIVAAKDGTVVRTVDLANRRTLTIGRSPRCDLTMDIESISRRHATMICLNNTWTLIDADSKSRFKVNNEKVDYAALSEERPIQIGGAFFWLQTAPGAPVRPSTEAAAPTEKLWSPSSTESANATLTIMDLEARPIHICALDGELTTVGTSPEADCSLDIEGWSPIQLALIQEQSGAALLDVSSEQQLRLRGKSCRRWASHEPTLLRCGDHLLQWEAEIPSSETGSGIWDAIQNDSLG